MQEEIGYILKGYPRTSETFILNEIFWLEQSGLKLSIFSLKKPENEKPHRVISQIRANIIYLPEAPPGEETGLLASLKRNLPLFATSHRRLFWRRPLVYLRALAEAVSLALKYRRSNFIKQFLQAGFIALAVMESGRIRHLHAHFCHAATEVAMLASRLCGVPFSFTAHAKDIYRQDMNPGDLLPLKLRRARFAVTCTRANQSYLNRLRPAETPLPAIYHGLDLARFVPSEHPVKPAVPLILSVGRLVEKKGFNFLIEACRLLKDRGCEFQCQIIGGAGTEQEKLKALIVSLKLEQTVTLLPAMTQEGLLAMYRQATVFALPCQVLADGDRDGIPNVLVEAMAMKLPVVSTPVSGIPELIENDVNGLLIPPQNSHSLAIALETLLNDVELRTRLGESARQTVCRHFDIQRNVLALKELFDEC
ncbi:MAG: glycosyltransferase family 4 protein [Acidobacteriota bacterium]|nr:glycosyltransferase family 4 protein [Acidobacteriota bacterium]